MTEPARWCASSSIFPLSTSCGNTTARPIAWSTRCWTAGEEQHADGDHTTELLPPKQVASVVVYSSALPGNVIHVSCSEPDLRGELHATSAGISLVDDQLKRFGAPAT